MFKYDILINTKAQSLLMLYFTYQFQFPLLPVLPLPSSFLHPSPIYSSEWVNLPMENQESLAYPFEEGQRHSPIMKAEPGTPPKRVGSKKTVQAEGINPGSTASCSTNCPSHTTLTHIQKANFGPMQVPPLSV